jgi:hypothetical protein
MSINFPTDSSVQGTYTSFPYTITNNDGYVSSNYVNILSTNNSNYTRNASNVLQTNINTTNTNLTATNTNLTNNYYNRTSTDTLLNAKEQILSFTAPLTRSTNTIGISLSSYSTTGTDTNYLLKTGGTMTGAITNTSSTASTFNYINISHSTGKITHMPFGNNIIYLRAPVVIDFDTLSFGSRVEDFLIYLYGTDYGFGINGSTLRYNANTAASHKFYSGTTNTATIGNTGIITATTFAGSGASLTNVPYTALTGTVPFYTKAENDTLLNAKQATLTGTTTLLGTGGSITALDYNKITTNPLSFTAPLSKSGTNVVSIDLSTYALNTTLTTAQTNNSNYTSNISNVLLINYNSLNTTTNINNSNYASNISNILTIRDAANLTTALTNNSNYASNISNVIIINSSNYASNISNVLNINSSNYASNISNVIIINSSNYASNISNVLNINSSNYASNISNVIIRNSSNYASNISNVLNINSSNYASNISNVIITNTNATYLKLAGGNITGNLGIGNPTPQGMLSIGRPDAVSDGTLTISKNNGTGGNRNFKMGYDASFNFCFGDFGGAASGNTWASTHLIIYYNNGYVGIGTTSVNNILQVGNGGRLRISNGTTDYTLIGTKETDDANNTRIVIWGYQNGTGNVGSLEYVATTTGVHKFYTG